VDEKIFKNSDRLLRSGVAGPMNQVMRAIPRDVACIGPSSIMAVVTSFTGPLALVVAHERDERVGRWIGRRYLQEASSFAIGDQIIISYHSPFGKPPGARRIIKIAMPGAAYPWSPVRALAAA
jgi:hypothetical protein